MARKVSTERWTDGEKLNRANIQEFPKVRLRAFIWNILFAFSLFCALWAGKQYFQILGWLDAASWTAATALVYSTGSVQNIDIWEERCQQVSLVWIWSGIFYTLSYVCFFSGQFFELHLKFVKLNELAVPFHQRNLAYLLKVSFERCECVVVYTFDYLFIHRIFMILDSPLLYIIRQLSVYKMWKIR